MICTRLGERAREINMEEFKNVFLGVLGDKLITLDDISKAIETHSQYNVFSAGKTELLIKATKRTSKDTILNNVYAVLDDVFGMSTLELRFKIFKTSNGVYVRCTKI